MLKSALTLIFVFVVAIAKPCEDRDINDQLIQLIRPMFFPDQYCDTKMALWQAEHFAADSEFQSSQAVSDAARSCRSLLMHASFSGIIPHMKSRGDEYPLLFAERTQLNCEQQDAQFTRLANLFQFEFGLVDEAVLRLLLDKYEEWNMSKAKE